MIAFGEGPIPDRAVREILPFLRRMDGLPILLQPELTVTFTLPDILPDAAVTVADPAEKAVTKPLPFTVATAEFPDVQVTLLVMLKVVPSE